MEIEIGYFINYRGKDNERKRFRKNVLVFKREGFW